MVVNNKAVSSSILVPILVAVVVGIATRTILNYAGLLIDLGFGFARLPGDSQVMLEVVLWVLLNVIPPTITAFFAAALVKTRLQRP
jgi:hypothetical protein